MISRAERLLIFVVFRAIFADDLARVRKPNKIKSIVQQHWSSCESSVGDYNIKRVVHILGNLLKDGVFESETRARAEFPELFRNFFSHRTALGDGLADAGVGTTVERFRDHTAETEQSATTQPNESSKNRFTLTESLKEDETEPLSRPCLLPKNVQHRILTNTQSLLENSCFDFASRWLPTVLLENGWDCAVACELQRWVRVLKSHVTQLPDHALCGASTQSLEKIARSIPRLRHTAVHRLSLTTNELLELLASAIELTVVLQDQARAEKLKRLHDEVKAQVDSIGQSKNRISEELRPQLRRIEGMRAGLINREKHLVSQAKEREKHAKDKAIKKLEDLISETFLDDDLDKEQIDDI